MIEYLEQSKDLSVLFDRTKETDGLLDSIKKMELNLSKADTKADELQQEKHRVIRKILECLHNAGIQTSQIQEEESQELTFEVVLEKVEQLLTNYKEDQRQMESILGDNSKLHSENEDLSNANYDLRYELQELNIKFDELKQKQAAAPVQTAAGGGQQLEAKFRQLTEETNAMR